MVVVDGCIQGFVFLCIVPGIIFLAMSPVLAFLQQFRSSLVRIISHLLHFRDLLRQSVNKKLTAQEIADLLILGGFLSAILAGIVIAISEIKGPFLLGNVPTNSQPTVYIYIYPPDVTTSLAPKLPTTAAQETQVSLTNSQTPAPINVESSYTPELTQTGWSFTPQYTNTLELTETSLYTEIPTVTMMPTFLNTMIAPFIPTPTNIVIIIPPIMNTVPPSFLATWTNTPTPSHTLTVTSTPTLTPTETFTSTETPTSTPSSTATDTPEMSIYIDFFNPPYDGAVITGVEQTNFQAIAYDPNIGTQDGAGTNKVVFSIYCMESDQLCNSGNNSLWSYEDDQAPFCVFGGETFCNVGSDIIGSIILPDGNYNNRNYSISAHVVTMSGEEATVSRHFRLELPVSSIPTLIATEIPSVPPTDTPTAAMTPTPTVTATALPTPTDVPSPTQEPTYIATMTPLLPPTLILTEEVLPTIELHVGNG